MKVLSLFDGMAVGLQALKDAGIPISEYHAFEIDKYAITIAKKNHPEIIHHGDVTTADWNQFKGFDLLIGGSPCQGFSFAGKQLAFDDERSKLFFDFVKAKEIINPKYFLLENVKMKKIFENVITEYMEVNPIEINSALVSAQNRKRLYWCNWEISQPEDKNIILRDILEDYGLVDRDKSHCIDANYWKGTDVVNYLTKSRRQLVFGCAAIRGRYLIDGKRQDNKVKTKNLTSQYIEFRTDQKTNCLTSVIKDNVVVPFPLAERIEVSKFCYRYLTPVECERLQTLPDNYTEGVSNTQRYKMLGNGWTKDVIKHIFECIDKKKP